MKYSPKDLSVVFQGKVSKEERERRWDICKSCEFMTYMNRCKRCGCFMKAKVRFKQARCPEAKW